MLLGFLERRGLSSSSRTGRHLHDRWSRGRGKAGCANGREVKRDGVLQGRSAAQGKTATVQVPDRAGSAFVAWIVNRGAKGFLEQGQSEKEWPSSMTRIRCHANRAKVQRGKRKKKTKKKRAITDCQGASTS